MKKNLLLIISCYFLNFTNAQQILPKGVTQIGGASSTMSFLLKDINGILWEGAGAIDYQGKRGDKGLMKYKDGQWIPVYTSGIFTDVIEIDTILYFSTFEGLYKYESGKFTIDTEVKNETSIANFNNNIMLGTQGNGLFEKTATGFKNNPIKINGIIYDTINCMITKGGILWLGTSNGLVKYDGNTFSQYSLPIVKTKNGSNDKNQKNIKSIQIDADDRVWVLNSNTVDSIDCIYVFENGQYQSGREHYNTQCITKTLFPYSARNLALDKSGHVIIGMGWGVLILGKDSINSYLLEFPAIGRDFTKVNAWLYFSYADKDGILYTNYYKVGYLKIQTEQFNASDLLYDGNMATNTIDINDIKTIVGNIGINFPLKGLTNPTLNQPSFKIPSIGCASAMYTAGIWMGGIESGSGDLHLAAETYRQTGIDFKPGPINLLTKIYDSVSNAPYNRIWKINRQVIDDFIANRTKQFYVIPREIIDWPAHGTGNFTKNLAPFVDTDKNGIYEPLMGDYPKIKGDQMLWWVFNDLGAHKETNGKALGVEVHGSCYAYLYRDLSPNDSNAIINRTIFFDYKIINRSDADYTDFNIGLFNDPDLGYYTDDYVGCDTINNAGFCYNGDNYDEGRTGFGKNPPMIFCKILNQKMNACISYNNNSDPINGNPNADSCYYYYMQGKTLNNKSFYIFNTKINGKDTMISTKFIQENRICGDTSKKYPGNSPADRRFLMSAQVPVLKKDSIVDIEFAYILLHDPSKNWLMEACDSSFKILNRVQGWYNKNTFPSCPYYGTNLQEIKTSQLSLLIYPNPAQTVLNLNANIENSKVREIEILDNSGKLIYSNLNTSDNATFSTTIDIGSWAAGIYLVKINTNGGVLFGKVVKE
ncbi:MAG: T9SS type A sorting domain-containing protein [bacterium]|nr:T9SS type A sorting domain-containing protein [bacterium]